MEYCLDTSVYIQAYRTYYAFDLAPGFWDALDNHANGGILTSPAAVYAELIKGKDILAQWAKDRHGTLFLEPDKKVVEAFRQIADFSNQRYDDAHWIRDFLAGADPWVVAQAKAHNLTVVTMEGNKSSEEINKSTQRFRGKIKIPNMCGHFGIKCISTFELIRTLKISLG